MNLGTFSIPIQKIDGAEIFNKTDCIAVEEPLEIRLSQESHSQKSEQTITVTMRTPGHDIDLALGFLYSEGIISDYSDVEEIVPCGPMLNQAAAQNIVRVKLHRRVKIDWSKLKRHSITNSSCGICGKTSLEALRTKLPSSLSTINGDSRYGPQINQTLILNLPELLRDRQTFFNQTGGLHASALFSAEGELMDVREDVGRHNALDKIIGSALRGKNLPLKQAILLVSGRLSFELVQKASMAGIPIIAAVGAPSSLAVELAADRGMTMLGFIRNQGFNIYCGAWRLSNETTNS